MTRLFPPTGRHLRSRSRLHREAIVLRPGIETLEGRLMLDAGGAPHPRPSATAVGRAPSSYFADAMPINSQRTRHSVAHEKAAPQIRDFPATHKPRMPIADVAGASPAVNSAGPMRPTVSLSAPEINGSNFESLNPYTFSITYSDMAGVNQASIWDAGVEVRPPVGSLLSANLMSITPSGPTDSRGNAPRETATYQLTPPGGSWGTAPAGSYAVILAETPVIDLAGNPVVTSTAGTFSVRIGVRRLVVFAQPPGYISVGSPFGLTVGLEDRRGNLVTSFHGPLSISLSANPGGATLGGTLTANASDGAALFSGLTLNQPGEGYTLQVSGAGLHTTTARFDATDDQLYWFEWPPGPKVVSTPALQDRGGLDQITVLYSTTMDPATVTALQNYTLVDAGPDHEFGTRDDRKVPLKGATENAFGDAVTLTLKGTVKPRDSFLLIFNAQQPSGLRDSSGRFLNAWGDSAASWNEILFFGRPSRNATDPFFQALAAQLMAPSSLPVLLF
jgi:hypothetical protein